MASSSIFVYGDAWESVAVTSLSKLLQKLGPGYALRITYSATDNGKVWICLPLTKAGWTGIGQSNPIIRGDSIIIPYSVIKRATGNQFNPFDTLYIKGNTQWTVTKIEVVRWTEQ